MTRHPRIGDDPGWQIVELGLAYRHGILLVPAHEDRPGHGVVLADEAKSPAEQEITRAD